MNYVILKKSPVEVKGHIRVIAGHREWVRPHARRQFEIGKFHTVKGQDYAGYKYNVTGLVTKDSERFVTVEIPKENKVILHLIDKETIKDAYRVKPTEEAKMYGVDKWERLK